MPFAGLVALLGWNWSRHRRGKSTMCSNGRGFIPPAVFVCGWLALTVWILPHYLNGFDEDR